jgi:hypothetical protein
MFPEAASKIVCLQSGLGLEDPHNDGVEGFVHLAQQMQRIMPKLIDQLLSPLETPESA